MKAILTRMSFCVGMMDNWLAKPDSPSDVPQGSMLGPLLFPTSACKISSYFLSDDFIRISSAGEKGPGGEEGSP